MYHTSLTLHVSTPHTHRICSATTTATTTTTTTNYNYYYKINLRVFLSFGVLVSSAAEMAAEDLRHADGDSVGSSSVDDIIAGVEDMSIGTP